MSDNNEIDDVTGVETTGHTWDGIKELNNPLPRWWLYCFYATIVFAVIYTIAYPAWPGISNSTKGMLGWSSRGQLGEAMAAAQAEQATMLTQLASADLQTISVDPNMSQFAVAGGASAYKVYCSQCHGSAAAGGGIYPNLVDDDWIWGGTLDDIHTTLKHGIRYDQDADTRFSEMPAYGRDEILGREEIEDVAWYVRKISNQEHDAEAAARGETTFLDNCAACHGDNGEGVRELGAPKLNDAIWLYGGSHNEIVAQINNPKQGVMPAWEQRLDAVTIKQLAVYVHSLGGGE